MTINQNEIESIRQEWGARLLILGHHYQSPAVLAHAEVKSKVVLVGTLTPIF